MNQKIDRNNSTLKTWHIILIVILLMYAVGKIIQKNDANSTKVFDQKDRKEIYYHDENGNIIKRETIYYDGRPTEYDYY